MEEIWETFNGLFKTVHAQGRRIEDLESRVTTLERRLAETEVDNSRLRLVTGETEVDELAERAAADRCEQVGAGRG